MYNCNLSTREEAAEESVLLGLHVQLEARQATGDSKGTGRGTRLLRKEGVCHQKNGQSRYSHLHESEKASACWDGPGARNESGPSGSEDLGERSRGTWEP